MPSPWNTTMRRLHQQTSSQQNQGEVPGNRSSQTPLDDEYNQATALTANMPLPQETAIDVSRRTRNNSLILPELINEINTKGTRERAALATVFGIQEYTDGGIFWETAMADEGQPARKHSNDMEESVTGAGTCNHYGKNHDENHAALVECAFKDVGLQSFLPSSSFTHEPFGNFSLPDIPAVSNFNDLLAEDDFMFPANPSSVLLHHLTPIASGRSVSSDHNSSHLQAQTPPPIDLSVSEGDIGPPLLFIDYPPAIFDLLKSDDDPHIIVWGPDPNMLSASLATTGQNISATCSAYSSLAARNVNACAGRPALKGFSSNTTAISSEPPSPISERPLSARWSLLPDTIRLGNALSRPRSRLMSPLRSVASDTNIVKDAHISLKTKLSLKRSLAKNRHKTDNAKSDNQEKLAPHHIPMVIEAATVEKLVEKLTSTIDYTFMTDFFLTYRLFISPIQLCKLLILRFDWALANDTEERRIVRIRTFVVLRHWLLNYFVHDFIPSRELRVILTSFLNGLPRHPLVKSSPRDQRIVKGLKRVVRRLKKVYYYGSTSERVKVILPPPATDQLERVKEMARAQLSQGVIRRKTALVRGVNVGGKHNGNMAIQDTRQAQVVVIGSVQGKHTQYMRPSMSQRSPSRLSSAISHSADIQTIKASYLQRMQQQKKMEDEQNPGSIASPRDSLVTDSSQTSVVSDDSLDSAISPGTTDTEEDMDDDEQSHRYYRSSFEWVDAERLSQQWENERHKSEEDEEQQRKQFFTSRPSDGAEVCDWPPNNEQPSLNLKDNTSTFSAPHTLRSPASSGPGRMHQPSEADPSIAASSAGRKNTNKRPPLPPQFLGSDKNRDTTKETRTADFNTVATASSTSPLTNQSSTASRSLTRMPSERWCRKSPDEDPLNRPISPPRSESLPVEIIRALDINDLGPVKSATGLSINLSRKSIERRKSENELRAGSSSPGPYSANILGTNLADHIPDVPPLRQAVDGPQSKILSHTLSSEKRTLTPMPVETSPIDNFEAIPYDQTTSVPFTPPSSGISLSRPVSKRSLSKAFKKVLKQDVPATATSDTLLNETSGPESPSLSPSTDTRENPSAMTASDRIVSRIAQQLRNSEVDIEPCDCRKCTGEDQGPVSCRRLSILLAGDEERRHSLELRRRRGASIDREPRSLDFGVQSLGQEDKRSNLKSKHAGPIYLGHLDPSSEDPESQNTMHIQEAPSISQVESDADSALATAVSASINTVSTSRADLPSEILSITNMIQRHEDPELTNSLYTYDNTIHHTWNNLESNTLSSDIIPSEHHSFILDHRSAKMAQQFCLIERDILLVVDWEDLVHCRWTKMDHHQEHSNVDRDNHDEKASILDEEADCGGGVEQVIERFNTVCQWVASEIVRTRDINERTKLIEKFIRLAQKCKLFSNFATLVQIVLGLQSPSISRLKKTWSKVGSSELRLLDQLSAFTSPMRNWKHIRDSMTLVAEEHGMSSTDIQIELPSTNYRTFRRTKIKYPFGGCIPFLGIYLSDLVFNSEQPPYLNPGNEASNDTADVSPVVRQPLVNFRKHRIMATVIKRVLTFRQLANRYSFDIEDDLYELCWHLQVLDSDAIRKLSHEIE
ncbi:uncharacterized protein BYT42DRAFT_608200 [Radiomyces spectabilis]|uniref:uncharacterized protein n=1 Tax=Radiomyces spectabilis TaxID=64574 RepID=UPI0022210571|nr:uncharacterized protein BYT42DRAFT_608200 [Radiomyces spectabilis]KAI8367484.1 hypothetical protein BYT42DRAFT_608200 [Radiomyces spectabilis]